MIKRAPVASNNILVRSGDAMAAATKLVTSSRSTSQRRHPDFSSIRTIIDKNRQAQDDSKNVLEVNPELELAGKILTSCIISPNDLTSTELFWTTEDIIGDAELTNKLIEHVRKFFRDEYKLEDKINDWIYKALFTQGSFPICVIPESSLDDLINGPSHNPLKFSFESAENEIDKNLLKRKETYINQVSKIKGKNNNRLSASLESDISLGFKSKADSKISVGTINITCDVNKLKVGNFNIMKREHDTASHISSSFEDGSKLSFGKTDGKESQISKSDLAAMFHARRTHGKSQFVKIKATDQTDRPNIGHPLHMYLPPESVAPVVNPGDPENAVGYLVLLDENKNPISRSRGSNYFEAMRKNHSQNSATISSVHQQMFGKAVEGEISERTVDQLYTQFSRTVEDDTLSKLRDGLYDKNVELGDTNDFYRIMFTRTLQNANTEILYIPSQLMTYLAYNYNEIGVGISLLEKNKMLSSLKSVIVFSNAMANMNNAVPRKEYKINFDPTDENPDKTMEQIMTNIGVGLSNGYPFSDTNPMSIVNSMLMSAIQISVTGHPEYNDTTVESNEVRSEKQLVDREYEQSVSDRLTAGLTLIPELVNTGSTVDFALEAANRNLMFSKTIKGYQKISNEAITDSSVKYVINSGKLTSELLTIIANHDVVTDSKLVDDYQETTQRKLDTKEETEADDKTKENTMSLYLDFLDKVRCKLPSPEETKVSNQIQLFESYSQAVETVVEKLLTNDRIVLMLGEDSRDYADTIRDMASGYLIRQYMTKNNVFPELIELVSVSDADVLKDLEHQFTSQTGLESALYNFIKDTAKRNASLGKTDGEEPEEEDTQEY